MEMPTRQDDLANPGLDALPRVGGMSSIPSRANNLAKVLAAILPQVDRLHLFLHGYTEVPMTVRHPKIIPELAKANHPYRASGKFFGLLNEHRPCLYFTFDDDIIYSAGHVTRLERALVKRDGKAVVGIHGVRFRPPYARYTQGRKLYHFTRQQFFDHQVDQVGMGTSAFLTSRFSFDPVKWPHGDMDDLMIAIEAEQQGLKRIAIARPRQSLVPIDETQTDSLWARALADDSRHTEQLHVLLRLMGKLEG
jgi:hypothetical protein